MATQIFVNLPVKDLKRSKEFFIKLGFSFNPQFENEDGACLVLGENIFFMLLVEKFFKTFISKEIADASKVTEVINAFGVESRTKVDEIVDIALKVGGTPYNPPQEYGWMYSRSFQDPDMHLWEVVWTDPAGPPPA